MKTGRSASVSAGVGAAERGSWPLRREWGRDAQCLSPDRWL